MLHIFIVYLFFNFVDLLIPFSKFCELALPFFSLKCPLKQT